MEAKHTPGPWFAVDYAGKFDIQNGPMYEDKDLLCYDTIWDEESFDKETVEANVKLMAAAPELLEACERALQVLESENIFGQARLLLAVAIKKATE